MKTMHILIADSSARRYQQYKAVFEAEADMVVVGHATCADEVLYQLEHSDVILLESSLCRGKTVELVGQIRQRAPAVQVLLTGIEEEGLLVKGSLILRYVEAGAMGYILTREPARGLLRKVRAVVRGRALVSPQIAACLITHLAHLTARAHRPFVEMDPQAFAKLTPRQEEVLALIAEGLTNQQIARRLEIKLGTVKNHVHHIFKKLKVDNRFAAAALYQRWQEERNLHLLTTTN